MRKILATKKENAKLNDENNRLKIENSSAKKTSPEKKMSSR